MPYDPRVHHRRSIRLKDYDYRQAGAYFVTICTHGRKCVLASVAAGAMVLSPMGRIVRACWDEIPVHFLHVELDAFVIMPNHVHGIIVIVDDGWGDGRGDGRGTACRAPTPTAESFGKPVPGSLPTIIRSFKSAATHLINRHRGTPGAPVWQGNYYEHVIRDERGLARIREYMAANPARWALDGENPHHHGADDFDRWLETG